MNLLRMHGAMAMAMAGALALAGCSDDGNDPDNNNTIPDSGIPDTGTGNNTMDAGEFTPPDVGFVDVGFAPDDCPDGEEGCECTSTFVVPDSTAFAVDDCEAGLLCIPWDDLSGRNDLTGPVQSCVRPCQTDADCGTNADGTQRACVDSAFDMATGAGRICVDAVVEDDVGCSFSKLGASLATGIDELLQPGRMTGCRDGTVCQNLTLGFVHPDEGICLNFCDADADCTQPETPYCNPQVFSRTVDGETVGVGVCNESRKEIGALCGSEIEGSQGIVTGCDTSTTTPVNTFCIPGGLVGLPLPDGLGVCNAVCNDDFPCEGVDPALGPTTCSDTYLTLGDLSIGVCGTGCTAFPNDCAGDGPLGAGRFCAGAGGVEGADFCMEVLPPPLEPGVIQGGIINQNAGGNCLEPDSTSFMSCPQGSTCFADNNGTRGWCFFGCSLAPDADPEVCSDFLGTTTATCAEGLFGNEPIGLCSDG